MPARSARIAPDHELLRRRWGRNAATGLCLVGFIAVMFALSLAKIRNAGPVEGFDHVARPALAAEAEEAAGEGG